MGCVLLFYKYVNIRYPVQLQKWQRRLCESLKLTGRIIIAYEGINGTLGGSEEQITEYIEAMQSHELFFDVDFKTSQGSAEDFPRLSVVVKPEIVHLGITNETISAVQGGRHVSPEEAHSLLKDNPNDLLVFDARNAYESAIGAFEGAVKPPLANFRELPDYVDNNLEQFRDKTVLMYCTGGVRCERASAYLKNKNVAREVLQISGGIHRYVESYPDGFFRGKNYVFDQRVALPVTNDVLGNCVSCNNPCDRYVACSNPSCREQLLVCERIDTQHNKPQCTRLCRPDRAQ
jgi:predicted sulfurtransferase